MPKKKTCFVFVDVEDEAKVKIFKTKDEANAHRESVFSEEYEEEDRGDVIDVFLFVLETENPF